jgi:hypothetical protein
MLRVHQATRRHIMNIFRRFQAWLRRVTGYRRRQPDWLESYNAQPVPVKDDLIDMS